MLVYIKQLCRGCKRYQSLKGMDVFVKDKPGSLMKVLQAFQEQGISISCVDTIQSERVEKPRGFHIVYECSRREHADVEALRSRIEQCVGSKKDVDIEGLQSHDSESDLTKVLTKRGSRIALEFTVNHVCGALIRVLTILNDNGININYLNTLNQDSSDLNTLNQDSSDEYREFIVEGHIFKFTRESLRTKLEECGLRSAKFLAKAHIICLEQGIELNIIKYQVQNSIGCFYRSLKELDGILKSKH